MLLSLLLLSIVHFVPHSIQYSYIGQVILLSLFSLFSHFLRKQPITPVNVIISISVSLVLVGIFRAIFIPLKNYLEEHDLHLSILAKLIAWIITVIISFYLMIFVMTLFARILIYFKERQVAQSIPSSLP